MYVQIKRMHAHIYIHMCICVYIHKYNTRVAPAGSGVNRV